MTVENTHSLSLSRVLSTEQRRGSTDYGVDPSILPTAIELSTPDLGESPESEYRIQLQLTIDPGVDPDSCFRGYARRGAPDTKECRTAGVFRSCKVHRPDPDFTVTRSPVLSSTLQRKPNRTL